LQGIYALNVISAAKIAKMCNFEKKVVVDIG